LHKPSPCHSTTYSAQVCDWDREDCSCVRDRWHRRSTLTREWMCDCRHRHTRAATSQLTCCVYAHINECVCASGSTCATKEHMPQSTTDQDLAGSLPASLPASKRTQRACRSCWIDLACATHTSINTTSAITDRVRWKTGIEMFDARLSGVCLRQLLHQHHLHRLFAHPL